MWFFNAKRQLGKSGLLNGFTDCHCHILPGVDDGVETMEDALAILVRYEQTGIRKVWLTPHIMEDMPNTTDSLRQRFAALKAAYHGPITLCLSAENMLDSVFSERFRQATCFLGATRATACWWKPPTLRLPQTSLPHSKASSQRASSPYSPTPNAMSILAIGTISGSRRKA